MKCISINILKAFKKIYINDYFKTYELLINIWYLSQTILNSKQNQAESFEKLSPSNVLFSALNVDAKLSQLLFRVLCSLKRKLAPESSHRDAVMAEVRCQHPRISAATPGSFVRSPIFSSWPRRFWPDVVVGLANVERLAS